MKRSFKMLAAAMFAAAALFTGFSLQAQDKPTGGFKNAFLNMGKSGKVSLTYTLWDDQVGKGSYTLAFFWASWSDEAREQLPYVKEVYKKYAGKLKVLGVTYGDEITDSMEAIPEWGIPFPSFVFVEDAAPDGEFDIDSIPLVILFGPDGSVVARDLKGEEIEKAITNQLSH
jgi:thiol-disulfide isomerase/thioredoxin